MAPAVPALPTRSAVVRLGSLASCCHWLMRRRAHGEDRARAADPLARGRPPGVRRGVAGVCHVVAALAAAPGVDPRARAVDREEATVGSAGREPAERPLCHVLGPDAEGLDAARCAPGRPAVGRLVTRVERAGELLPDLAGDLRRRRWQRAGLEQDERRLGGRALVEHAGDLTGSGVELVVQQSLAAYQVGPKRGGGVGHGVVERPLSAVGGLGAAVRSHVGGGVDPEAVGLCGRPLLVERVDLTVVGGDHVAPQVEAAVHDQRRPVQRLAGRDHRLRCREQRCVQVAHHRGARDLAAAVDRAAQLAALVACRGGLVGRRVDRSRCCGVVLEEAHVAPSPVSLRPVDARGRKGHGSSCPPAAAGRRRGRDRG